MEEGREGRREGQSNWKAGSWTGVRVVLTVVFSVFFFFVSRGFSRKGHSLVRSVEDEYKDHFFIIDPASLISHCISKGVYTIIHKYMIE